MQFTDTGKIVYDRTYSRTKPNGDKETWPESVIRVVDGNLNMVEDRYWTDDEREALIGMMTEFKIIPAGRHLWASGVNNRQYIMNCWVSHWPEAIEEHFEFSFLRLMEGGGVGANYSNKYLEQYDTIYGHLPTGRVHNAAWDYGDPYKIHIVCDSEHPDYQKMKDAGVLSVAYSDGWDGAFEVEDSREGWATALVDLIQTYYRPAKNQHRVFDVSRVRAEGARLKTFGGRASGPMPLAVMLRAVADVFNKNIGTGLDGISAMEVDHAIAQCVVSGGNRRSARMSIMRWDDPQIQDFINLKANGGHWTTNISVEVDHQFWGEVNDGSPRRANVVLDDIVKGMLTNGEPGFWNSSLSNVNEPNPVVSTNPCLPGDQLVSTDSGLTRFQTLFKNGGPNNIVTDSRISFDGTWSVANTDPRPVVREATPVFKTASDAETVTVATREGFEVTLTPDHHIATPDGMVRPDNLNPGDEILITKGVYGRPVVGRAPESIREIEYLLMGLIAGDGWFNTKGHACISIRPENFDKAAQIEAMLNQLHEHYKDVTVPFSNRPYKAFGKMVLPGSIRYRSRILGRILDEQHGFNRDTKKSVPDSVLAECREGGLWYLAGLFFCDGTVYPPNNHRSSSRVELSQSNKPLLQDVQRMLAGNGIYSRIYVCRKAQEMQHGKGGCHCKASYRVAITSDRYKFGSLIGFWDSAKDKKLSQYPATKNWVPWLATVESVTPAERQDVYCLTEPISHSMSGNSITMRQCGEIPLTPWEPCNLGHINLAAFVDPETGEMDYQELGLAHHLMTRFLIRATYSDVNDPKSRDILDRNRRIGVGHLGVASAVAMMGMKYSEVPDSEFWQTLNGCYKVVQATALNYAHDMRIPVPVKLTTVAPTRTIAKMPKVSEGIHPIFAKYFIRRIRFSNVDPDQRATVENYRALGYHVEPDTYADNTTVVEIPTKDSLMDAVELIHGPSMAEALVESAADISLVDMLRLQCYYQVHWADNAVSFTVNVDPDKYTFKEVMEAIKVIGPDLKGLTLFPEQSFMQAPYQRITKPEFDLFAYVTSADGVDENCATGACPVK